MNSGETGIRPSMPWEKGLFDALLAASSKMPEPLRSVALRRSVEETEFCVRTAGRDMVGSEDLLRTVKVAVSRSMYDTVRRALEKQGLIGRDR